MAKLKKPAAARKISTLELIDLLKSNVKSERTYDYGSADPETLLNLAKTISYIQELESNQAGS